MAKKRTIIEQTIPDQPLGENPIESPEITWNKIKVYKIMPGRVQPVFCFSSPTDIDEEVLQTSSFGGGRYEVHYLLDTETLYTKTFEIAEPPQPPQPQTPESIQMQMYKEQSQMNRELLLAVLGQGGGRSQTPMNELANMWAIMSGHAPNGGGGDKMIDVFMKGIELAGKVGGDMDWKSALIQTVREIAPTAAQAFVAAKTGTPMPEVASAPNGNGAPPPPQIPPTITPEALLKPALHSIKPLIMSGLSIDSAVEWVTIHANNPQYQELIKFAMSKTFDDLAAIDPDISNEPYKKWLQGFMAAIKENFTEETEVEDDSK